MKTLIILGFTILLLSGSCQKKNEESNIPTVSGIISNHQNEILTVDDFLGKSSWQQTIEVKDSVFEISLELSKPVIKTLGYGNTRKDLFLQPNKSLKVSFDADNIIESYKYEGDLAIENTILDSVSSRLKNIDYSFVYGQPLDVAAIYIDSLNKDCKDFFQELTLNKTTSDVFIEYTNAFIEYDLAFVKLMLGERKDEQPHNYYGFLNNLTFTNPDLLDIPQYRMFLLYHIEKQTNSRIEELDSIQRKLPDAEFNESLKVIRQLENDDVKAYCLYNAMIMKLKDSGIKDFDIHYEYFKLNNKDPHYKEQMFIAYNEKKKIAPGQPAPEFTLEDLNRNRVSLNDFKGKYVYLDFWQTLCSRSARELPHYLKLQSEYDTENIAFVSISVNEDEEVWRDYVKEKKNVGTSLRATEYFNSKVYKEYQVNGLPSFVLIDTEGNIIDPIAPKPSSDEIRTIFDELLNKN